MNTLKNNQLIAEFLGLKRGWWISQEKPLTDDKKQWCDLDATTFLGSRVYFDKDLQFHSDWSWLMPVWKMLRTKCNFLIGTKQLSNETYLFWKEKVLHAFDRTEIDVAHDAIAEIIKWYNENSKS